MDEKLFLAVLSSVLLQVVIKVGTIRTSELVVTTCCQESVRVRVTEDFRCLFVKSTTVPWHADIDADAS